MPGKWPLCFKSCDHTTLSSFFPCGMSPLFKKGTPGCKRKGLTISCLLCCRGILGLYIINHGCVSFHLFLGADWRSLPHCLSTTVLRGKRDSLGQQASFSASPTPHPDCSSAHICSRLLLLSPPSSNLPVKHLTNFQVRCTYCHHHCVLERAGSRWHLGTWRMLGRLSLSAPKTPCSAPGVDGGHRRIPEQSPPDAGGVRRDVTNQCQGGTSRVQAIRGNR